MNEGRHAAERQLVLDLTDLDDDAADHALVARRGLMNRCTG